MKPLRSHAPRTIQYGLTLFVLISAVCVYGVKAYADEGVDIAVTDSEAMAQLELTQPNDAEIILHGAQAGIAEAQVKMALLYEQGDKVEQNEEEALFWYQMAANQEHPEAQFNLGLMLLDGRGTDKDGVGANYWIERAAQQEYLPAILHLARHANNHLTLPAEDLRWLEKAAEKGDAVSQLQLGYYYLGQYSLGHNLSKAEFWLNNAAKHGLYDAQAALVELYTLSIYQLENDKLAHYWREVAAQSSAGFESKNLPE